MINIAFNVGHRYCLPDVGWNISDALSFYGTILTFIGTVSLGILSLHQNNVLKQESDERQRYLDEMEHNRNLPLFSIVYINVNGKNIARLKFDLINMSNNAASNIEIVGPYVTDKDNGKVIMGEDEVECFRVPYIDGGEKVRVAFENHDVKEKDIEVMIKISCQDKYTDCHNYKLTCDWHMGSSQHIFYGSEIDE